MQFIFLALLFLQQVIAVNEALLNVDAVDETLQTFVEESNATALIDKLRSKDLSGHKKNKKNKHKKHKKRHKYTKNELKKLKNKKKIKYHKKDKVGDNYYQNFTVCSKQKDLLQPKKCRSFLKRNITFCSKSKHRKVCSHSCCQQDYWQLSGKNSGCHEHENKSSCVGSKDGRKDKRFAKQACTWCCGHFCTGPSTNLCEPTLWLFGQKNFIHMGENAIGFNTCPGWELYDGYYANGYYYYSDGSPYHYGWTDQNGKYHYYYDNDYVDYWGSDEVPGDPKKK